MFSTFDTLYYSEFLQAFFNTYISIFIPAVIGSESALPLLYSGPENPACSCIINEGLSALPQVIQYSHELHIQLLTEAIMLAEHLLWMVPTGPQTELGCSHGHASTR